jgi:1-acyl-sn-glycerol-3-phosphate acyltransferase
MALRTFLFRLVFYGLSAPIVLLVPLILPFGQRAMIRWAHLWTRTQRWAARTIIGVRSRVEGTRPSGQVLYAAKHQAMYETLELQLILDAPAMVLKQELARIPLWGAAARRYGAIAVDRDASAAALRRMVGEAAAVKATGRSILLYPEGTRVKPGEAPPLRSGFAGLYKALGLPVVPIALDSGLHLPRGASAVPGDVTVRLGDPIPPGLPRREVEARVWEAINALEPASRLSSPDRPEDDMVPNRPAER